MYSQSMYSADDASVRILADDEKRTNGIKEMAISGMVSQQQLLFYPTI